MLIFRAIIEVVQGQYLPSLSINYIAINKVSANYYHSCMRYRWKVVPHCNVNLNIYVA